MHTKINKKDPQTSASTGVSPSSDHTFVVLVIRTGQTNAATKDVTVRDHACFGWDQISHAFDVKTVA